MSGRLLDPLDKLMLLSITRLMEQETLMSTHVDALNAVMSDMSATVTQAVDTIDRLATKVMAMSPADPNDQPAIEALTAELAGLTDSLKAALARSTPAA